MIIVKQNKDIINFSKVTEIKIVDYEAQKKFFENNNNLGYIFASMLKANLEIDNTKLSGYGIHAYFEKENWSVLAKYKTEERAKEVLAEITEFWKNGAMSDYKGFICYEMPED